MPITPRALSGARLSRRGALAAVAAVTGAALAGCTGDEQGRRREDAPEPVEPQVDPDVLVAAQALANQRQILELLAATQEVHARLIEVLAPVVAAHEAHAALLEDAVPADVSASPSTAPTPASPSPDQPGEPGETSDPAESVPQRRDQALARVVLAEAELATATKRHAFRAQSGAFARLLSSIAASSAQYQAVLSAAPAGGRPS